MHPFRKLVFYLQLVSHFYANRPFGAVIYDISNNNGLDISDLRKLEKLSVKRRKAELDLTFLKNCKVLRIIPKFLCFQIPYGSTNDLHAIRKRLLRNAITERLRDKRKLDSAFETHCAEVRSRISAENFSIL